MAGKFPNLGRDMATLSSEMPKQIQPKGKFTKTHYNQVSIIKDKENFESSERERLITF